MLVLTCPPLLCFAASPQAPRSCRAPVRTRSQTTHGRPVALHVRVLTTHLPVAQWPRPDHRVGLRAPQPPQTTAQWRNSTHFTLVHPFLCAVRHGRRPPTLRGSAYVNSILVSQALLTLSLPLRSRRSPRTDARSSLCCAACRRPATLTRSTRELPRLKPAHAVSMRSCVATYRGPLGAQVPVDFKLRL